MPIKNRFEQIMEERINEILLSEETPREFKLNSGKLYFPLGCCCHDCIKTHNPIKKGEPIYFLYPSDKRKIGVLRAYCVTKRIERGYWKNIANA